MRILTRCIQSVRVRGGIVFADGGARFHCIRNQPVVDDSQIYAMLGIGKRFVNFGFAAFGETEFPIKANIVGRRIVNRA